MSGSARVRVARLARDAALSVPGVTATHSGRSGRFVTAGDGERLEGVLCAAAPSGGYDVSLRLRCRLVPLRELAEQVKDAVTEVGAAARLTVARIHVDIVDVTSPETA